MYSTSSTMVLHRREDLLGRRGTQPEVFTFEHIPEVMSSTAPTRPKKRCTRVMYPAKVRMHLPPPEKSAAKRCLLLLLLVLLWQIYTEDPCVETPTGTGHNAGDYQGFPTGGSGDAAPEMASSVVRGAEAPAEDSAVAGRTGNTMVALLVYHRLGADN
ncbi:radiation-inducible immediate-early gene IEX-1 [Corythoichthys intestinalis]|uniref:radiation-inducible immediate-early gene IEX-1 n=1 Tax=Corythoichthys intestinalis TaxID=161448 RepID=UPI0025A61D93|nr:radiation-inducible immediate-early gene IEX-1 [Corythoichthys intestinalis]